MTRSKKEVYEPEGEDPHTTVARSLEGKRMKLTDSDCEKVLEIMLDIWSDEWDGLLTREIAERYGLSMQKTLYVMKELFVARIQNYQGTLALDFIDNDGKNGFMKHTHWHMLDARDLTGPFPAQ